MVKRTRAASGRMRGFTLIELLVVLAVLAILASMVAPHYLDRVSQAREAVLRQDLAGLRSAIDQYYRDRGRYPDALDDLVRLRYVRAIPEDPLTGSAGNWVLIAPAAGAGGQTPPGAIFDIRSAAPGNASDGSAYANW